MTEINRGDFDKLLNGGHRNVVTVGDPFKVRGCWFMVETISDYGISARGITEADYVAALERDPSRRVGGRLRATQTLGPGAKPALPLR